MRRVKVISKKYDGSLRDEYETELYDESAEAIILFSVPGIPYWDYRKAARFIAQDGLIEIYFKNRWYNVWHITEQVSKRNLIYINISLPATLTGETLEWVDLDLDYRVHMDNAIVRLDQEEFQLNARRFNYPLALIDQALAACREVEAGLASHAFPFDYEQQVKLYWQIKQESGLG